MRSVSQVLPRWARRSRSFDALLPDLYLRGVSTGDSRKALSALPGPEAEPVARVISRLTGDWERENVRWRRWDFSARRYVDVYVWADVVYLQPRIEPDAECILFGTGAIPEGGTDLVGFHVCTREIVQSWRKRLIDLNAPGPRL